MTHEPQIAILASGKGSNFQSILNAIEKNILPAKIATFITNNPSAGALKIAQDANIPTYIRLPKNYASRRAYDSAICDILRKSKTDVVVLAGFMRVIGPPILDYFKDKIVNIHPSLLPAFKGLHAQQQALDYGVKITGCTVHFVDNTLDGGPIILQRTVPIKSSDTIETLSKRIQVEEHIAYPEALRHLLLNDLEINDGRIVKRKLN